jgi:hypothetical protein
VEADNLFVSIVVLLDMRQFPSRRAIGTTTAHRLVGCVEEELYVVAFEELQASFDE